MKAEARRCPVAHHGQQLDQVEHLLAKGAHQGAGIHGADAVDHARSQILLDGLHRGRLRGRDLLGLELQLVLAVDSLVARCTGNGWERTLGLVRDDAPV